MAKPKKAMVPGAELVSWQGRYRVSCISWYMVTYLQMDVPHFTFHGTHNILHKNISYPENSLYSPLYFSFYRIPK